MGSLIRSQVSTLLVCLLSVAEFSSVFNWWIYLVDHNKWGHSMEKGNFMNWHPNEGNGGTTEPCTVAFSNDFLWADWKCEIFRTAAYVCETN